MKRFLKKNWMYLAVVALGAMITPSAIENATEYRGFSGGFGGEFLIIPLLVLLVYLAKGIAATYKKFFGRNECSNGKTEGEQCAKFAE